MSKNRGCLKQIRFYLVFLLSLFSSAQGLPVSQGEWWNTDWKYRGRIAILSPRLKSKIDTASFVFYPWEKVNKDFSDIRIIDEEGRETPYKIISGKNGSLIMDFRVDSPSKSEYYMYFGNPKAERIEYMWAPSTGGLFLETRGKIGSLNPKDLAQMQELIQKSTKIYGKGPRYRIDDLENPFGPNENYLSIYEGYIFCPLDGKYGFATNSDDASFLLLDDSLVASWPGGHEKEGGNSRPLINEWTHQGEIYLKQGVHLIQYYQEEGGGGQLARAGWKKPGDKEIMIIPEEAFIDKLKARQASFEAYGKPLNAFFFVEEKEGVIFNRHPPQLLSFQFQDSSIIKDSEILSYQWNFGDGRTGTERNPLHVYSAKNVTDSGNTYTVKLEVKDAKGLIDSYEQYIQVPSPNKLKNIQLDWGITKSLNIFSMGEPLQLGVWIKNYSNAGTELKLTWESLGQQDNKLKQDSREFVLGPNQAEKADIPRNQFPVEKTMNFYLSYGDNIIAEKQIEFLDADSNFKGLKVAENHIEDSDGSLILFRIKQTTGEKKTSSNYLSPALDRLNILMLGASLCNKSYEENYEDILSELWQNYYGDKLKINLNHVEISEDTPVGSGLLGISRLEKVIKQNPGLVMFSLGMNEIIHRLPLDEFKRSLTFLTAATKSRDIPAMLLIPPPVIGREVFSMNVAVAIKEVGLKQGIEVVDLFSAFPREEIALSKLYQPTFQEGVYLLYPLREGQRLIAEQIFERVKKNVSRPKD